MTINEITNNLHIILLNLIWIIILAISLIKDVIDKTRKKETYSLKDLELNNEIQKWYQKQRNERYKKKMTIKEATKEMLWNIERRNSSKKNEEGKRGKDIDIAKMLQITPTSYSRLRNGVTEPKIITWFKITNLHKEMVGIGATDNIINQIQ